MKVKILIASISTFVANVCAYPFATIGNRVRVQAGLKIKRNEGLQDCFN
jgi:hypothetical protein